MSPRQSPRSHTLAAFAAAGAALLLFGACSSDDSGTTTDPTDDAAAETTTSDTVEDCTGSDQVWLVVAAEDGTLLADECVGNPETGTAALETAGLELSRDSSGIICAMSGEPAECPATFDGKFWQYYTATPDGEWTFATAGSDDTSPQGGTLEGWCYGESCTPPEIGGVTAPSPTN